MTTITSLALASLLFTAEPQQRVVGVTDVQDYIRVVAPQVRAPRAHILARAITWVSRHFGVEPLLLVAIVRQESNFRPATKSCYIVARNRASYPTCDYGITQVNQVWVDKWGLEPERLVEDDAYALFQGMYVHEYVHDGRHLLGFPCH